MRTFLQNTARRTDVFAAKLPFNGIVIAFGVYCAACGSFNQRPTDTRAANEPATFADKTPAGVDSAASYGIQAIQREADAFAADGPAVSSELNDQTVAEQADETGTNLQVIDAGDPANLPVFRQAISDKDPTVREAAIQALAGQGPAALDLLREAFQDSDPTTRLMVVENIVSVPEASGILQEASGDAEASVREAAQRALDIQAVSVVSPGPEAGSEQVPNDHP